MDESEASEGSNYQSQNSQLYSQQSMPFFLQQIQNNVAQKAGAIPPKSKNKARKSPTDELVKTTTPQVNHRDTLNSSGLLAQIEGLGGIVTNKQAHRQATHAQFNQSKIPDSMLLHVPGSAHKSHIMPQQHPQSILKTKLAPPAQRQSFFQRIGLLRSGSDRGSIPKMQHSMTTVKRSWTKI